MSKTYVFESWDEELEDMIEFRFTVGDGATWWDIADRFVNFLQANGYVIDCDSVVDWADGRV